MQEGKESFSQEHDQERKLASTKLTKQCSNQTGTTKDTEEDINIIQNQNSNDSNYLPVNKIDQSPDQNTSDVFGIRNTDSYNEFVN